LEKVGSFKSLKQIREMGYKVDMEPTMCKFWHPISSRHMSMKRGFVEKYFGKSECQFTFKYYKTMNANTKAERTLWQPIELGNFRIYGDFIDEGFLEEGLFEI
jgi:hypothetical protein